MSVGRQVARFRVSDAAFRGFNRDLQHKHKQTQTAGINTHTHTDAQVPQIYVRTLFELSSVLGLAGSRCRAGLAVYSRRQVCEGGRRPVWQVTTRTKDGH